jgi:O-methyltransferase
MLCNARVDGKKRKQSITDFLRRDPPFRNGGSSQAMISTSEAGKSYLDLMKKALTASLYDESGWVPFYPDVGSRRNYFKNKILKALYQRSLLLVRFGGFDKLKREEGRDWPLFGYTMTGHRRLDNIQMCVEDVIANQVPGDLMETGVWRGGSTIFMRALLKAHGITDRKVWAADSFEGMPTPKDKDEGDDLSQINYLKVSLEQVKANFARFDLLDNQVDFIKGWFCDSLPKAPVKNLAVLRLDGDMYSSTMDALKNLYHKVSKGGYVIVDDYLSWATCRGAVTDFLASIGAAPEIKKIDQDAVYWKV